MWVTAGIEDRGMLILSIPDGAHSSADIALHGVGAEPTTAMTITVGVATRNPVERFFNKLKHFHAIATRYNKRARNFLGAIQLASAIILLDCRQA
jgi:hypothetical protein